jgi:IS30 family transposase
LDFEMIECTLKCKVYYAHPYCSFERGTNDNANRIIRRFLPKRTDFGEIPLGELMKAEDFINNYPRFILGGKSANQVFNELIA